MDTGAELEPFHIEIEEAAVADLRHRLARTRWPDQLPESAWALGTDVAYLRDLCEHWASGFDFDAFVARYNTHSQVRARIYGSVVHAIVAASDAADATPLLLLHGWPSTVAEYRDVIEPLRARHHVVVASLPGYGFSGPTAQSGVGPLRIAGVLVELMRRLGYERFVVAGGDWGAIIGSWMAAHHADAVAGLHVTLLPAAPVPGTEMMAGVTADEQVMLARSQRVMAPGTGYQAIQSTKPQSIAYGLTDSPAGLAGWIIEKFHAWSDCDGDLASVYSPDRLLENISIFWFTGTINSSMRLYHEAMGAGRSPFPGVRVEVPTGHAAFPGEIYPTPRAWGDHWFNVTRWSVMERGGHFAAMEVPEVYAAEVAAFTADL